MASHAPITQAYSDRVRWIRHNGKDVLSVDYTGCTEKQILKILDERLRIVTAQPPKSVLTLVNVTNGDFTRKALTRVKEVTALERPYVKRTALIGAETLPKGFVKAVATFSVRDFPSFATREAALDYLVQD